MHVMILEMSAWLHNKKLVLVKSSYGRIIAIYWSMTYAGLPHIVVNNTIIESVDSIYYIYNLSQ